MKPHLSIIYSLYVCFTHVYRKFNIAPRLVLTSEDPDSGKTTALEVAKHLALRPNPEALGSGAAIREFLDQGPGTVTLDDLDQLDAEAQRALLKIWNLGHNKRLAKISPMIGGKRKVFDLYASMIVAGIGNFLRQAQMSRKFKLQMEPYTAETRPERDYYASEDETFDDLNAVYSYLRHWTATANLNLKPAIPRNRLRRAGDNVLAAASALGVRIPRGQWRLPR